jgi:hypothetical protein
LALLSPDFAFSPAEVPPAAPLFADPLELSLLEGSPDSLLGVSPLEASEEELSLDVPLDVVDVVDVEVVWIAVFSADVSVGGVMSGVLLGTTSEVLLPPPHAPSVTPQRSTTDAARVARGIKDRGHRRRRRRSREASRRWVSFMRSAPRHRRALRRCSPAM